MSVRDTELAAALAAVDAFLAAEKAASMVEAAPPPDDRAAWREQAMLAACGVPVRRAERAGWRAVERFRHGAGGFYGVVGL